MLKFDMKSREFKNVEETALKQEKILERYDLQEAIVNSWEQFYGGRSLQNLRASRETELMAKYPAKDATAWIGNSVAVANKR